MRSRWLGIAVALVAGLVSAVLWTSLPPELTTHWSLRGNPDGSSSRAWAAVAGPALILGLTLLFQILPRIDPKRENYPKFQDVYWLLVNGFLLCLLVFHVALLASGAGAPVSVRRITAGCLAVLMLVLGNSLGRIRPNWFMGIRTPWTLASPDVWRRTHRVGAWLLVGAGAVTGAAALISGTNPLGIGLGAMIVAALVSVVLSLIFWLQEQRS
jgi:immunity protein, SdpI family